MLKHVLRRLSAASRRRRPVLCTVTTVAASVPQVPVVSAFPSLVVAVTTLALASAPDCFAQPEAAPLPSKLIKKLATLINGIVDLPYMDEDEEQEIFEHAVERIITSMQEFLPKSYWSRILTSKPLPEEEREVLRQRMVAFLQSFMQLPYLSDEDQKLVIHGVVAVVADAMGDTKLDEILDREVPPLPLVGIFIRGAMGIENVALIREQCQNLLQLPLPISIPRPIEDYVVNHVVDTLVSVLGESIDSSLKECFVSSCGAKTATSQDDFIQVLRANTTILFREHLDLRFTPVVIEEYFVKHLVDAYFLVCVDDDKIGSAISVLISPLEPPVHIQPLEPPLAARVVK
ncbi:hypothetical protein ACHHYP_06059 [Achlya hypogyna]|uniref:Uncharacterized protein n=1 Tax=Achlya hypogyna TaxID=1202772 RepID=A0A1V9YVC8_ACHHY|nr:hypothetical protein ACHHYP_06059 [Achlya hypogyna]